MVMMMMMMMMMVMMMMMMMMMMIMRMAMAMTVMTVLVLVLVLVTTGVWKCVEMRGSAWCFVAVRADHCKNHGSGGDGGRRLSVMYSVCVCVCVRWPGFRVQSRGLKSSGLWSRWLGAPCFEFDRCFALAFLPSVPLTLEQKRCEGTCDGEGHGDGEGDLKMVLMVISGMVWEVVMVRMSMLMYAIGNVRPEPGLISGSWEWPNDLTASKDFRRLLKSRSRGQQQDEGYKSQSHRRRLRYASGLRVHLAGSDCRSKLPRN